MYASGIPVGIFVDRAPRIGVVFGLLTVGPGYFAIQRGITISRGDSMQWLMRSSIQFRAWIYERWGAMLLHVLHRFRQLFCLCLVHQDMSVCPSEAQRVMKLTKSSGDELATPQRNSDSIPACCIRPQRLLLLSNLRIRFSGRHILLFTDAIPWDVLPGPHILAVPPRCPSQRILQSTPARAHQKP